MSINEISEKIEAVSQIYARRVGIERTPDWFILKLQEELGELTQAYMRAKGLARKEGKSDAELATALADEAADVFSHLLLFAMNNGVDVEKAVHDKWFKYL